MMILMMMILFLMVLSRRIYKMRVEPINKHVFDWLLAYIYRLKDIQLKTVNVYIETDSNIRIEKVLATFNKHHETFEIEYSDFKNELKYYLKIRIDTFKLSKHGLNQF